MDKSISHWGIIMTQDVDNAIGYFKNDCSGLLLDGGSESQGDFGDTSPDGIVQCVASVTMADASPTKTIGGCELASTGNAIVDAEMRQPIICDHEMTEEMFAGAKPAKEVLTEIYGAELTEKFLYNNRTYVEFRGAFMGEASEEGSEGQGPTATVQPSPAPSEPIIVWQFHEAPLELQELSTNGGDEDWLAILPPSNPIPPIWMDSSLYGCCSVDEYPHPTKEGYIICIGSHA
jgi:hypothetical protein